ncbi:type II secretion system F family protein [Halocola ammonii]
MSVNLKEYRKKAKTGSKVRRKEKTSILDRDISINLSRFGDKKKKRLYSDLALLIKSGLDLRAALEMVAEEFKSKKDKDLVLGIQKDVVAGQSISDVLKENDGFGVYEVESVRIGEESGRLVYTFDYLTEYFDKRITLKRQLMRVLAYPMFVIFVSVAVIYFMLNNVVPLFSDIFKRFDTELPTITKWIISISQSFSFYLGFFVIFAIAMAVLMITQKNKVWMRRFVASAQLKFPFFGKLVRKIYLARFCQSMYLLVSSGNPITSSLQLSRDMINFYPIEVALTQITTEVEQGKSLHAGLSEFSIFEKRMVSLIRVGEEVNQLDKIFEELSEQFNSEVEHQSSIVGSLLEPALIIFIALFVGVILISMYLPLFELSNVIK